MASRLSTAHSADVRYSGPSTGIVTRCRRMLVGRRGMKALAFAATISVTTVVASATECSPTNPEAFVPFLRRFSTEPRFALKRTVLPLRMLKWEYGLNDKGEDDSAPIKSFVAKEEYSQWPTLDAYMKSKDLSSAVDSTTRTAAVVKVFKPDTDWLMLYHFKLQQGCWRFWQYEDQSL